MHRRRRTVGVTGTGPEKIEAGLGGISGTVTDDDLTPVAGAEAAILEQTDIPTVRTDEAGSFVFGNIEPGKYTVAVQKLGFEAAVRQVTVAEDAVADITFALIPIAVREDPYYTALIGEGYFACGAYLVVTSWGNLHACVWDNHQPRFMQEIVWTQASALTAEYLQVRLQYGEPVCNPFCSNDEIFGARTTTSPSRQYHDMEDELQKFDGAPDTLSSLTFPDGEDTPVLVFQQRMTHYITLFYNEPSDLDAFTGIPDA